MSNNPFSPPLADIAVNNDRPGKVYSRVFRAKAMSFVLFTRQKMQQLRRDAEDFINCEVGADNVISIVEHTGYEYSIVVWYRTK